MIENLTVKLDDVGRIVIPKKIRVKLKIEKNDLLKLSVKDDEIVIKKEIDNKDFIKIQDNIKKISKIYNFDFIIASDYKILFASKPYKKYEREKINKIGKKDIIYSDKTVISKNFILEKPHYYCSLSFDNYTNGIIFIIFENKNEKDLAKLIIDILR